MADLDDVIGYLGNVLNPHDDKLVFLKELKESLKQGQEQTNVDRVRQIEYDEDVGITCHYLDRNDIGDIVTWFNSTFGDERITTDPYGRRKLERRDYSTGVFESVECEISLKANKTRMEIWNDHKGWSRDYCFESSLKISFES